MEGKTRAGEQKIIDDMNYKLQILAPPAELVFLVSLSWV